MAHILGIRNNQLIHRYLNPADFAVCQDPITAQALKTFQGINNKQLFLNNSQIIHLQQIGKLPTKVSKILIVIIAIETDPRPNDGPPSYGGCERNHPLTPEKPPYSQPNYLSKL